MMTRKVIRQLVLSAGILVISSCVILLTFHLIISSISDKRNQAALYDQLGSYIQADRYQLLDSDILSKHPAVKAVYLAMDEQRRLLGYIVDVEISDSKGILRTRMSISSDGEKIFQIRIVSEDGVQMDMSNPIEAELCAQFSDIRMPVALISQMSPDVLTQNEYPSLDGLHDGIFYAQADDFDRSGYKDFVEMKVEGGRITGIVWDAIDKDDGKNRAEASVDGEYVISSDQPIWAAQAFSIQNKLLEVQDPAKLAIKSDGKTEIIEGVKMDVRMFYSLTSICIENSINNVPKEPDPTIGTGTDNGDDNNQAQPTSKPEVTVRPIEVVETVKPTTVPDNSSIGNEDGVVDEDQNNILSDSIDGLPLGEIQTQIAGVKQDPELSERTVSTVNSAYKFLREYLKWGE